MAFSHYLNEQGVFMRKLFLGIISFLTLMQAAYSNELIIHIFKAPGKFSWNRVDSLVLASAKNVALNKSYPIGHFAVELNCKNTDGAQVHVLTGMARKSPKEANKLIRRKKLGLGALMYSFEGRLESSSEIKEKIVKLSAKNRYKFVTIPVSLERCNEMIFFLDEWIQNESYSIYGGNKDVESGEGAGCSDFAEQFFRIAIGRNFPESWIVNKNISTSLIGTDNNPVNLTRLLFRKNFVKEHENSINFRIADPTLAFHHINDVYDIVNEISTNFNINNPEVSVLREINNEDNPIWKSIKLE